VNFNIKKMVWSAVVGTSCVTLNAVAKEYFNPQLLETTETSAPPIDLALYAEQSIPPGDFNLDIYINDAYVDSGTVTFKRVEEAGNTNANTSEVRPCLSIQQLKSWNIRVESYPELVADKGDCAKLTAIPELNITVKMSTQRLELFVPQVAMLNPPRGFVPEDKWDDGINAGLLNYSLSGQTTHSRDDGATTNSQFAVLQPGLNLGAWRFRNYSTFNHDENTREWQSIYNYVERDIRRLKSRLTLGEGNTAAGIFDSLQFTGLQLSSDSEMLPDSLQGFAPVVRGIAKSNAQVTIYQDGYSIYKTFVPAGAFEIRDLNPTGSSGDLHVVVKEADGREQRFIVPYASLAILQREGQLKYSVVGGETRSSDGRSQNMNFMQLSAAYGLPYGITVYGGVQQAENDYTQVLAGSGLNLGQMGAVSVDVAQSLSTLTWPGEKNTFSRRRGESLQVRYSKAFPETGTDLTLAGYRISSRNYYSLADFAERQNRQGKDYGDDKRDHHRLEATISQNTEYGSVSLSWVRESYWDCSRTDSLSVGLSSSWGKVSWFLSYALNHNVPGTDDSSKTTNDNVLSLTINIPFNAFWNNERYDSVTASYSVSQSKDGPTTHNVGLNGTALANNALSWQAQEGYTSDTRSTSGNLSVAYQHSRADLSASYGYDDYSQHYNYALRGGALVHAQGLTLSRSLNETVALVQAPGVKNAPVNGQVNILTDSSGNAVVPYIRPYHETSVGIDTQSLADTDMEIDNVNRMLVPTRGSVVKARFHTAIGFRAMMSLWHQQRPVPFGAMVTRSDEEEDDKNAPEQHSNIVGDEGQVYIAGLKEKGTLRVKWGQATDQQCRVNYSFVHPQREKIMLYHAECL